MDTPRDPNMLPNSNPSTAIGTSEDKNSSPKRKKGSSMVTSKFPPTKKFSETRFFQTRSSQIIQPEEVHQFLASNDAYQIYVQKLPYIEFPGHLVEQPRDSKIVEDGIYVKLRTSEYSFDFRESMDSDAVCLSCPHTHYIKFRNQTVMSLHNHAPALVCWEKHVMMLNDKNKVAGSMQNGTCTGNIKLYNPEGKHTYTINDDDSLWRRCGWCFRQKPCKYCCCCMKPCCSKKKEEGDVKLYDQKHKKETVIGTFKNHQTVIQSKHYEGMKQMIKTYDIKIPDDVDSKSKMLIVGALISESWSNIDMQKLPRHGKKKKKAASDMENFV